MGVARLYHANAFVLSCFYDANQKSEDAATASHPCSRWADMSLANFATFYLSGLLEVPWLPSIVFASWNLKWWLYDVLEHVHANEMIIV